MQGTSVETYRGTAAKDIAATLAQSALVTAAVTPAAAGDAPGTYPESLPNNGDLAYAAPPPPGATLLNTAGYVNVFQTGGPLDVDVKIFNLMVLPGVSPVSAQQAAVLSDALAFCEQKRAFFIMDAPPNATTSGVG